MYCVKMEPFGENGTLWGDWVYGTRKTVPPQVNIPFVLYGPAPMLTHAGTETAADLVETATIGAASQKQMLGHWIVIRDVLQDQGDGSATDTLIQIGALLGNLDPRPRDCRYARTGWDRLLARPSGAVRFKARHVKTQSLIDEYSDALLGNETAIAHGALRLQRLLDHGTSLVNDLRAQARNAADWRARDLELCARQAQESLPEIARDIGQAQDLAQKTHAILVNALPLWERRFARGLGPFDRAAHDADLDIERFHDANGKLRAALENAITHAEKWAQARRAAIGAVQETIRILSEASAATAARLRGLEKRQLENPC